MAQGNSRRQPKPGVSSPKSPASPPFIEPNAAAVDVGATSLYAALPPDRGQPTVRCFTTFTDDLVAMADWMLANGITTVAMESTGVFWIPLFQVLEARGLQVCLVNARHVKNVRGRKTDVSDCQWLQYLHSVGFLQASFRPPDAVCAVRSILRHREDLVSQASMQIQLMQKALTQMNLQLHHVLSDITGKSGLAILDAILRGQRTPKQLAALCDARVKAPPETVIRALQGDWRPEHLFVLGQALGHYRYLQGLLRSCDQEIERLLADFESTTPPDDAPLLPPTGRRGGQKNELSLPETDLRTEMFRLYGTDLTQVSGLGPTTVAKLFAELGTDLGAFSSAKRFTSWLGLCPDPHKTGGRVVRNKTRPVKHRVATAFRLAAQALHHAHGPLGDLYRRLRMRLGAPEAITATAHKLARIFYHLVTTKEAYDESRFAEEEERNREYRLKRLKRQAKEFGFTLTPAVPTAVVS